MYTDLALAILDPSNGRGHPILAALMYVYCPAAARWWLAGADPQPSFDPVWQALEDSLSGNKLSDVLVNQYGYRSVAEGKLVLSVKQYIAEVDAFRRVHPGILAPELLPVFPGGQSGVRERFGETEALKKMGDNWKNLFTYTRAWAFLLNDWERQMKFTSSPSRKKSDISVTVTLPEKSELKKLKFRKTIKWPAWEWRSKVDNRTRIVLGILTDGPIDELRFTLIQHASSPEEEPPWPTSPEIYVLNHTTGEATLYTSRLGLSTEDLTRLIHALADKARNGPFPPLRALQDSDRCLATCGYSAQCFSGKQKKPRSITDLALGFD